MSPILVRPVREQLEHDRVIRLLQAKYKRKSDVVINPGNEKAAPVGPAAAPWYPDLVLQSGDRTKKLIGVVEVETGESLNHLEAMSQWATFSKLRVAFHLYVPASGVDSARRLCADLQIQTSEMWAYHVIGDQIRFTLVARSGQAGDQPRETRAARPASGQAKAVRPAAPRSAKRPTAGATSKPKPAKAKKPATGRPAPKRATARQASSAKPPKRK